MRPSAASACRKEPSDKGNAYCCSPTVWRHIIISPILAWQIIPDDNFICHTLKKGCKARKGRMTMPDLLPVGSQAPDFSLSATDGQTITLSELAGCKHVVLVFYVGDNTPD